MTETAGYHLMRAGKPYPCPDWHLNGLQAAARAKLDAINAVPSFEGERRTALLREALGSFGDSLLLSPVTWEYGTHIHIGDAVFVNLDCIFLDGADIRIGSGTLIAPRVQFLTAGHPVDPRVRITRDPATGKRTGGITVNKPITVGEDCWIGAGAILMGGISIGDGTTIGAGSVVTRDIPGGVLAAGNPCRVIRPAIAPREIAANAA